MTVPGIGHNNPPLTPYETVKNELEGLYQVARDYMDGERISDANIAAEVKEIERKLKLAITAADEARKAEAEIERGTP